MTIIVSGNPCDGLAFWGPFDDGEQAAEWAERNLTNTDWWLTTLDHPDTLADTTTEEISL